jgi:uncharacterized protein (DUF305 family)
MMVGLGAAALLLGACGQGGGQSTTASTAAAPATAPAAAGSDAHGAMAAAGPQTPYSASEQQMHQAMMQAVGSDPQHTYALKMIEHHRGAIEMSRVLMSQNPDPELRRMAEKTMADQQREIAELERWVSSRTTPGATGANTTPAG